MYIPGPHPNVDCGRGPTPPRHHEPKGPPVEQIHDINHDVPDNIDIKEIVQDPSYPTDYYRESYRPKDEGRWRSSKTKNLSNNSKIESDVRNMRPDGVDIEAELNPYTGVEDLRQSILQREEEFIVLDAISQRDQESYFDEVIVLQDEE